VTYVLQSRHAELEVFSRPSHAGTGPTFQAVIIVPSDSPAKTLSDLKGKTVAFGDPASTSGTWVPRYQLLQAGLVAGRDYTKVVLGAHDAVALAVMNRKADGGGLSMPIYKRLLSEHAIDPTTVRVLAESTPIPEYMWTFREGLAPELRDKVRLAFSSMLDPQALKVFRAEKFVSAQDSDVDPVRAWIDAIRRASPEEFSAL
jgi:phosphonate transport system substrate-binding protein